MKDTSQSQITCCAGADVASEWPALAEYDSDLLDLLPVAVYFCDSDGTLVRWNRCAEEIWGRKPLAGNDHDLFCGSYKLYLPNGEFLAHADCPMADALRSGQPQRIPEVIIERPDGSRRFVSAAIDPIRSAAGELIGAVNVFQDITDKVKAERARSQFEKRFTHLLDNLPAAAYTCDSEGLITYYNEHARELWGRSPALCDPVDRFCGSFRLFAPNGTPIKHDACWMALAIQTRREYMGEEIVIERPDGSRRAALAHATPFHDEANELAGAVNVLIDITEHKQAQNRIGELLTSERDQSEKLREADRRKDEFLAMLAHELRNPLAPIRSGLDILTMDPGCEQATVELMREQLEHLVRLVDDLLDVSRIMQGKIELRRETVELATLVERSVNAARSLLDENRHELFVSLPEQPIWLDVDPVRLVQVLGNLLNNASKYTEPCGKIYLSVETESGQAVIQVRDTGVGIESELLPRVFDLFAQSSRSLDRAKGGLGIGLTLVKNLVEMHGGAVTAQSDGLDKGSTFTVRLNVAAPAEHSGFVPRLAEVCVRRRILVVDDNRSASWLLTKLLMKLADHQIETAHDGPSALEKIRQLRPEIVLLDIGLPEMDGFQVGMAIREHREFDDVLLVALTGYGQEDHRRRSLEAGFDEHVIKPPSLEQLRAIMAHPKLTSAKRSANSEAPVAPAPFAIGDEVKTSIDDGEPSRRSPAPRAIGVKLSRIMHDLRNTSHALELMIMLMAHSRGDAESQVQFQRGLKLEVDRVNKTIEMLEAAADSIPDVQCTELS